MLIRILHHSPDLLNLILNSPYRGLKKNTAQIVTLFALSNLWMARHKLLACGGQVRLQGA